MRYILEVWLGCVVNPDSKIALECETARDASNPTLTVTTTCACDVLEEDRDRFGTML